VNGVKRVDSSNLKGAKWARDNDLRGDKYSEKTSAEIKKAVKDALLYDPRVSIFDITVEAASDGIVVLRGEVDNLKAKRSAAQDARNTVGVLSVENRLKVRPDVKISDNKLIDEIRAAFSRDPYLADYEISLKAVNGGVKLFGLVDTAFEKAQAEDAASRVKGVISIDNNLIVRDFSNTSTFDPWVNDYYLYDFYWYDNMRRFPGKSDSELMKDIKNELNWSPFVDADQIEVTVKDGIATLRGRVDSWLAYNIALQNAYKGGAIYVYNKLTVR
jgi:osmotically-inducible protein OsmY